MHCRIGEDLPKGARCLLRRQVQAVRTNGWGQNELSSSLSIFLFRSPLKQKTIQRNTTLSLVLLA